VSFWDGGRIADGPRRRRAFRKIQRFLQQQKLQGGPPGTAEWTGYNAP
jgi:hypothetical protein